MNFFLIGTVDKKVGFVLKVTHCSCVISYLSIYLVNAGIHRKRSDVSDWTRAWDTASDGVNSYMLVN